MAKGIYRKDPLFLAICSPNADFEKIKHDVQEFFAIPDNELRILQTDMLLAMYCPGYYEPLVSSFINKNGDSTLTVAPHVVYDQRNVADPEFGLDAIFKSLQTGESKLEDFPAPLSIFRAVSANESVTCYNDAFGVGKIYYSHDAETSVISNSIPAVALGRQKNCSDDKDYWSAYYCGGAVGDSTYIEGVKLAPPGSRVVMRPDVFSMRSESLAKRLLADEGQPIDTDTAIESFLSPLVALAEIPDLKQASIGLSGGRDSRLIAALVLKSGLKPRFHTAFPPLLESEIASTLVKKSPLPMEWRTIDRTPPRT